jgi:hypothetical protein
MLLLIATVLLLYCTPYYIEMTATVSFIVSTQTVSSALLNVLTIFILCLSVLFIIIFIFESKNRYNNITRVHL